MLKRYHRFFQSIQGFRDAFAVALAFWCAHVFRFAFPAIFPYESPTSAREALTVGVFAAVVFPSMGFLFGLYESQRTRSRYSDIFEVIRSTVISFFVLVTLVFFIREIRFSRGTLLAWIPINIVIVALARAGFRSLLRKLRRRGYNLRHVLVVGEGAGADRICNVIKSDADLGMRLYGLVSPEGEEKDLGASTSASVLPLVQSGVVDQVIFAMPMAKLGGLTAMMDKLSRETVDVRLVPDFYEFVTLCGSVDEFRGMPIINLQASPTVGWGSVLKRSFDVACSALGLLLLAPVFLGVAMVVRFSSPGPVFFKQHRVGLDGRPFTMLKFRSMRSDAESKSSWTVRDDPRRTKLGRFLRKTSLDELPQLLNVLRGEMSLVGPRPEQPQYIEDFKDQIPRYALRHKMKAGMTGWAQVQGLRGDTSVAERIEADLYYIEHWTLWLDIKIILRTIFGGFMSPNAY